MIELRTKLIYHNNPISSVGLPTVCRTPSVSAVMKQEHITEQVFDSCQTDISKIISTLVGDAENNTDTNTSVASIHPQYHKKF